jgi:hypothetical protein
MRNYVEISGRKGQISSEHEDGCTVPERSQTVARIRREAPRKGPAISNRERRGGT